MAIMIITVPLSRSIDSMRLDAVFTRALLKAGRVAMKGDSCNMGTKVSVGAGFAEGEPRIGWFDLTFGGRRFFNGAFREMMAIGLCAGP